MKTLSIAVAALFAAAAPAAFAQYDRDNPRYDSRYDSRDQGPSYSRDAYPGREDRENWRDRNVARVLETKPLYAAGSAREECWNDRANHYEEVRGSRDSKVGAGTALGAVVGGVIGHQFGSGRGNTAATAGGAVLGGLLGHRVENRDRSDDQPDLDRSRCRVVADGGASPVGYDVRYQFQGREFVTRMDHDPGQRLRVGRDIRDDGTPLDDSAAYRNYGSR